MTGLTATERTIRLIKAQAAHEIAEEIRKLSPADPADPLSRGMNQARHIILAYARDQEADQ